MKDNVCLGMPAIRAAAMKTGYTSVSARRPIMLSYLRWRCGASGKISGKKHPRIRGEDRDRTLMLAEKVRDVYMGTETLS